MAVRAPASALIVLSLLLTTGIPVHARKETTTRIAGVGENEKGKPVPVDVLSTTAAGVRVAITYMDSERASRALGTMVEGDTSIFRPRTDSSPGHLVFAVEIDNQSGSDVLYQPGQGRLVTDRTDAKFPMDYTMLYRLLAGHPGGAPPLEEVEKAVYSRAMTIRSGGSVRKLLVFEGPRDGKFKKLEVRVGALQVAEQELDPRFHFRRFKVNP